MNAACEDRLPQLVDALEGAIPAGLEPHLARCSACREALEALREARALVAPGPAPEPPAFLAPRLRAALETSRRRRRLLALALPSALAAATLLFLLRTTTAPGPSQRQATPRAPAQPPAVATTGEVAPAAEAGAALAWSEEGDPLELLLPASVLGVGDDALDEAGYEGLGEVGEDLGALLLSLPQA